MWSAYRNGEHMSTPYGYVPPNKRGELSQRHVDALRNGAVLAGEVMGQPQQTHHARSDDNAITVSVASLISSAADMAVFLVVTALLGWLVWLVFEVPLAYVVAVFGVGWGCIALRALYINREQQLRHTPAGIAHHELDNRKEIALYAIDKHTDIIMTQLGMDSASGRFQSRIAADAAEE